MEEAAVTNSGEVATEEKHARPYVLVFFILAGVTAIGLSVGNLFTRLVAFGNWRRRSRFSSSRRRLAGGPV